MGRSIPWRHACPTLVMQRLQQLQNARLLLLQERGPMSFVLKDCSANSKKYSVGLGDVHSCTCPESRTELCVHILFVLSRLFRIPGTNPLLWQRSLLDAEIQNLLFARNRSRQYQRDAEREAAANADAQREPVERKPITSDTTCAICITEMSPTEGDEELVWCKFGCGQSCHAACFREYAQHNASRNEPLCCPLCRQKWSQLTMGDYGDLPRYKDGARCDGCLEAIVFGDRYRCVFCSRFDLCAKCYLQKPNVHRQHSFDVQHGPGQRFVAAPARPTAPHPGNTAAATSTTTPDRNGNNAGAASTPRGGHVLGSSSSAAAALMETIARAPDVLLNANVAFDSPGRLRDDERKLTLHEAMHLTVDVESMVVMRTEQARERRRIARGQNDDDEDDDDGNELNFTDPNRHVHEEEDEDILGGCIICTQPLDSTGLLLHLPACDHLLHVSCGVAWLTGGSASCPWCRRRVAAPESSRFAAGGASSAVASLNANQNNINITRPTSLNVPATNSVADPTPPATTAISPPRRNHLGLIVGNVLSRPQQNQQQQSQSEQQRKFPSGGLRKPSIPRHHHAPPHQPALDMMPGVVGFSFSMPPSSSSSSAQQQTQQAQQQQSPPVATFVWKNSQQQQQQEQQEQHQREAPAPSAAAIRRNNSAGPTAPTAPKRAAGGGKAAISSSGSALLSRARRQPPAQAQRQPELRMEITGNVVHSFL